MSGWLIIRIPLSDVCHRVPVDDSIDHTAVDGEDCVCGPNVELRNVPGRRDVWVHTHHALDGRPVPPPVRFR